MTFNDTSTSEVQKIFTLENNDCFQAVGFSGNIDALYRVLKNLENNEYKFDWDQDDFSAILIDHAGTAWIVEKAGEVTQVSTPWAIGSGGSFAHGAMEAGATALQAVKIATALDIRTGNGFDAIKIITE